jgi:hypothetical protein
VVAQAQPPAVQADFCSLPAMLLIAIASSRWISFLCLHLQYQFSRLADFSDCAEAIDYSGCTASVFFVRAACWQ